MHANPTQRNLDLLSLIRRMTRRYFQVLAAVGLSVALLVQGCASRNELKPVATVATQKAQVTATNGMVASAHALASQAGLQMLKAGGNAIDAAVAAAFAVGVVEPNDSGIGGEGVMLIYRADTRQTVAIDYRSAAPASASFASKIPTGGHAGVAVPGTVAGLSLALQQYGTMKLPQVMAPAIKCAADGFVVSATLAGEIADNFDAIQKNEALSAIMCPQGLPLEAGATLKNPDLARSLKQIAAGGPEVFYRGELAEAISADMAAHGGFIAKADLAAYHAIARTPVKGTYRGFELVSAPPPIAGLAVIEILQILNQFDLAKGAPLSPENVHLMVEAMKRGFVDFSAFVADPDFVKVPIDGLLSPAYARSRAAEIRPDQLTAKVSAGEPFGEGSGSTTSLCAVDRQGNIAVLTQTISDHFGAKVVVPGTGILLNNEMKNFSTRGINAIAPGKRMRGTLAPTILLKDGKPYAALGTPGAARIVSTTAILISNLIDHKLSIQEAIESPRFYAREPEPKVSVEARVPAQTLEALKQMGYSFQLMNEFDLFFGGAQGIVVDRKHRTLTGGADPRRDGAVAGF
jgi:gamma-glutamyltranspeptidase / glutathione hydrolase